MYKREIEAELEELAKGYPVITVTGPRQSGKTTLVKQVFPDKPYVNLEDPEALAVAVNDPRAFLRRFPKGAILDEIQQAPRLLSYIQVIVDEAGQMGMFILTGSHQLRLHESVTQSLAGRTALLFLLPLSLSELTQSGIELSLDEALYTGGYPGIYSRRLTPTRTYRNYFQTYIQRDLHQLMHVKDLTQFKRFVGLCAGRIGQLVNYDSLAGDVGVSPATVREWLSILEASFIIIRLQPYHENFGRRIIKSPKLYFTDVGLACYLLGIKNTTHVARDPLRGNLIENLVLLELMKTRLNRGLDPHLFYWRDAHGNEVDFLFQDARELIAIEVKGAQTYNQRLAKGLLSFQDLVGKRCPKAYLIYAGEQEQAVGEIELINYKQAGRVLSPYD
ncbi:MAG: ATP-binding protein [Parachlamydiales bacterium]